MIASGNAAELQRKTRKERGFEDTEASLPDVSTATGAKLLNPAEPVHLTTSTRGAALLSYLGEHNPHPLPVTDDDAVWLLDNVAFKDPETGDWKAEFVAAVFAKKPSARIIDAVASISEKVGLAKGHSDEQIIEQRLVPFLMDIQPGRLVEAMFASGNLDHGLKLGPGGRNGISSDLRVLPPVPDHQVGDIVTTEAQVPSGANGLLQMKTLCADPEGWMLVSGKKLSCISLEISLTD
jgi:hypothetical protein